MLLLKLQLFTDVKFSLHIYILHNLLKHFYVAFIKPRLSSAESKFFVAH